MIIIKNKGIDVKIYIPKDKSDVAPSSKKVTITQNGLYQLVGRNDVTVDVKGGDCEEVIRELQTQINVLETEKAELQESLNTALNQIEVDNNTISELQAAIEAKNAEISEKTTQIATLQGELDELQSSIDATREVTYNENGSYIAEEKIGYNKINVNIPTVTYVEMTQAQYNALSVKDKNTIYLIRG